MKLVLSLRINFSEIMTISVRISKSLRVIAFLGLLLLGAPSEVKAAVTCSFSPTEVTATSTRTVVFTWAGAQNNPATVKLLCASDPAIDESSGLSGSRSITFSNSVSETYKCGVYTTDPGTPVCSQTISVASTSSTSTTSTSTCNASYCKDSCDSTDDTTQTACKSVCTDASKTSYCPPKSSTTTSSSGTASQAVNISLANPLKYSTVQEVLMALLYALQGVIVVLSLVFIVIGAVFYITSAGNTGRVSLAKGAIFASLIGLAIGILAPTFLKEIATVLGWSSTSSLPTEVSSAKSASDILLSVLNFLLGIVGTLSIIMLVIGGGMFLTAAGSQDRITTGKKIVSYSLLGIIVALASLVIVRQIASFFATS